MNNQWVKILVFGLLFAIGGYLIGRHCGHGCCGGHGHDMACCSEGGEGCNDKDHMHGEHGMKGCCMDEDHMGMGHGEGHEEHIHALVHKLKESGFQGDTTIMDEGATVTIGLHGDKTEVRVEISDSTKAGKKVMEKTVEMH